MYSHQRQRFTLLFFIFLYSSFATSMAVSNSDDTGPVVQTTPLVSFLQRVQLTALQSYAVAKKETRDPKPYIDLSLKLPHDLSSVVTAFNDLTSGSRDLTVPVEKLEKFLDDYFDGPGEDIGPHEPEDFVSDPSEFLLNVENNQVREWALEVHGLWKTLSRKVSDSVRESPDRHTLLPLPEPVIVPGSRFREVYYWDSYWVIKRFLLKQIAGCLLVAMGVVVAVSSGSGADHTLSGIGLLWPAVMVASAAFQAGASIIKGKSLDIFVVNSFGSGFRALFVFLLLPFLSNLKGIPFGSLLSYIKDGAGCFFNTGAKIFGCDGAPLLPLLYIVTNLAFNISLLHLVKISSAIVPLSL